MNPTHDEKKAIFLPKVGSVEGDAVRPQSSGIHEGHRCEHPGCVKWGHFGFGTPGQTGGTMRWYCGDHRGNGF